jgi:hypothetical protein
MNIWSFKLGEGLLARSPNDIIISKEIRDTRQFSSMTFDKDDIDDVLSYDNNYYEVIPETLPRKFYVDIDISSTKENFGKYSFSYIIEQTHTLVKNALSKVDENYPWEESKIHICRAKTTAKQSLHLMYPMYFKNQADIKCFSVIISSLLNPKDYPALITENETYFDFSVYKRNQNMRCLYQSKVEKNNPFVPFTSKDSRLPADYLAGLYRDTEAYSYMPTIKMENMAVNYVAKKAKCSIKLAASYLDELAMAHTYEKFESTPNYLAKSSIEFYLSCIPNNNQKPQTYDMWYSIGQALKNLEKEHPSIEMLPLWIRWSMQASDKYKNEAVACAMAWSQLDVRNGGAKYKIPFLKRMATHYSPEAVNFYHANKLSMDLYNLDLSGYRKIDIYNKDLNTLDTKDGYCKILEMAKSKLYTMMAGMGTGKTSSMFSCVENLKKQNPNMRMAVLTVRKTYANEKETQLKKIFPNIKKYNDPSVQEMANWYHVDQIIIQVESLHHLNMTDIKNKYDIVILDEIESIDAQFSSPTNGVNVMANFDTYMNLIHWATYVISADAFITNRTAQFVKRLGIPAEISINKYKKNDRTAVILGNAKNFNTLKGVQKDFVSHLIKALREGKKCNAISGSLGFKKVIIATLIQEFGEEFVSKHVKQYDSESSPDTMMDLDNVNAMWSNPDVLLVIYTTVITVGVSYDVKDFDRIYIYGTAISSVVRDIIQAHFRVRHINENKIYVSMFSGTPNDVVSDMIDERRKNKHLDSAFARDKEMWTDPSYEDMYTMIRDYNTLEDHISTWNYDTLFKQYLVDMGYSIEYNNDEIELVDLARMIPELVDYHTIKMTDKKLIDRYEKKIMTSRANKSEKLIVKAYYFYKNIVMRSGFPKYVNSFSEFCDTMTREEFELESFMKYHNNKMFFNGLNNIAKEALSVSRERETAYNRNHVIDDQKQVMKLVFVKHICDLIEWPKSYSLDHKITQENIIKVFEYYKNLKTEEKDIFVEVFNVPTLNCKTDVSNARKLLSSCFENWNSMKIKSKVVGRDRSNGRNIMLYNYVIECPDELLKIWSYMF